MGDSDRVPPTHRALTVTTLPSTDEIEPSVDRTDPISFPLFSRNEEPRETERKLVSAPRTSDERATLTFLTGIEAGQVYSIPQDGCTIGRGTDTQYREPADCRHSK